MYPLSIKASLIIIWINDVAERIPKPKERRKAQRLLTGKFLQSLDVPCATIY